MSPDGRWLAYVSNESGRSEVYVEPFRREGNRMLVSPSGGGQPKWRADGRELFFTTLSNRLVAVTVRPVADRIEVSLLTELFGLRAIQGPGLRRLRAERDGKRFLVKLPVGEAAKPLLQVVTNWTALLQ